MEVMTGLLLSCLVEFLWGWNELIPVKHLGQYLAQITLQNIFALTINSFIKSIKHLFHGRSWGSRVTKWAPKGLVEDNLGYGYSDCLQETTILCFLSLSWIRRIRPILGRKASSPPGSRSWLSPGKYVISRQGWLTEGKHWQVFDN